MRRLAVLLLSLVIGWTQPAEADVTDRPARVCVTGAEFLAASEAGTRRQIERIWGQRGTVDPSYQVVNESGEYVAPRDVVSVNYRQCSRPQRRRGVTVYYEWRSGSWHVLAKVYPGKIRTPSPAQR